MPQPKKKINARELVNDIRGGVSDLELMAKYELSPNSLKRAFARLVQTGLLEQREIDDREKASEKPVPVPWTCPACEMTFEERYDECPNCGVVEAKYHPKEDRKPASPYAEPAPPPGSPQRGAIFGGSEAVKVVPLQRIVTIAVITAAAATILSIGVSLPVIKLTGIGGISLWRIGKFSSMIKVLAHSLVILAWVSVVLAIIKSYRILWLGALGSAGILGYAFLQVTRGYAFLQVTRNVAGAQKAVARLGDALNKAAEARVDVQTNNASVKGLATQVHSLMSVELGWGWIVLVMGVLLLVLASLMGTKRSYD
jgi:hypothetical protein